MSEPVWTGPLTHRSFPDADALSVTVQGRSFVGVLDLRLDPSDEAGRSAVGDALGLTIPAEPRTSSTAGDVSALWLSVDQWLIVTAREQVAAVRDRIADSIAGHHHCVTDVSDLRAVFRLSGDNLRPVLAKCLPIDVYAEEFAPGFVRRVTFGEIAAALHVVDHNVADIYVFRSYADYALTWIEDAARQAAMVEVFAAQKPANV